MLPLVVIRRQGTDREIYREQEESGYDRLMNADHCGAVHVKGILLEAKGMSAVVAGKSANNDERYGGCERNSIISQRT